MKILIITTITLLMSLCALSQNPDHSESNFGIKGGYNLAAVSFEGEGETGQRHSFHIGFYGESFLTNGLALQPEFIYSQQGYEIQDDSGTFTQKLNYINVPLMLKAYPTGSFFLESGPQVGISISHKEEFDSNFNLFDTSQEFEPRNFDWGVNFGAGFKTETGLSLGVRYHLGLGDIYNEGNSQNRGWQFYVGIGL